MRKVTYLSDVFVGKRISLPRHLVCSMQGYFPVVAYMGKRHLVATFRVGAPHIGIEGTLAISHSLDGGQSWTPTIDILPRGWDRRNQAFGITNSNDMIIAGWTAGLQSYKEKDGDFVYTKPKGRQRQKQALFFMRSINRGSKYAPYSEFDFRSNFNSLHSDMISVGSFYGHIIKIPNNMLAMCLYGAPRNRIPRVENTSVLLLSYDDGLTWVTERLVANNYSETAFVYLPDGTLLAALRSDEKGNKLSSTFLSKSSDLGQTWSEPEQITREGEYPADLTILQSGYILLTYGRRIKPYGCGALLSYDKGKTWNTDHEILLASDSGGGDCGYPSTVQLDDGHIVTLLYYANGSGKSMGASGWGDVSCQAIYYSENDIIIS